MEHKSENSRTSYTPKADDHAIAFSGKNQENHKWYFSPYTWRLIFFVLSMAVLISAAFTLPLWQPLVSVALLKILLPVLGAIVFGAVAWLKYHDFQERVKQPSELPKSSQVLFVLSGIFSMVSIVTIAASPWLVTVLSISTISVISLACLSIAMLLPAIALWIISFQKTEGEALTSQPDPVIKRESTAEFEAAVVLIQPIKENTALEQKTAGEALTIRPDPVTKRESTAEFEAAVVLIQPIKENTALEQKTAGEALTSQPDPVPTETGERFLLYVAQGEQDKAEAMLRNNPALASYSGTVTDLSERRFTNITAFQYAVWAMDWHMWTMLLNLMSRAEAAKQLEDWGNCTDAKRNEYRQHTNSLVVLIEALNEYIKNSSSWEFTRAQVHWCEKVGGAQRGLVAHAVNEFCREYLLSEEKGILTDEDRLPRTRDVYCNSTSSVAEWFSLVYNDGRIGASFAYQRLKSPGQQGIPYTKATATRHITGRLSTPGLIADRDMLASLFHIRSNQLVELRAFLSVSTPSNAFEQTHDSMLGLKIEHDSLVCVENYAIANGHFIIPNSVTHIGDKAFDGCKSLTRVTIPNSVIHIGDKAFEGCKSLTRVTIPNSVTHIGDWAFSYCKSLRGITIPNGVTHIGNGAFSHCESLTRVTIPNSVTHIRDSAFYACFSLMQITIPNGVTHIGDGAFFDCESLMQITIPDGVTSIRSNAFFRCISLQYIVVNSGDPVNLARIKALLPEALKENVVSQNDFKPVVSIKEAALKKLSQETFPIYLERNHLGQVGFFDMPSEILLKMAEFTDSHANKTNFYRLAERQIDQLELPELNDEKSIAGYQSLVDLIITKELSGLSAPAIQKAPDQKESEKKKQGADNSNRGVCSIR